MGQINVILPAMGEGIFEATITQWLVKEGDVIEEDDSLVEIATDKVDSEIPSPSNGTLEKILVPNGEIAKVGQILAIISNNEVSKNTSIQNIEIDTVKGKVESFIEPQSLSYELSINVGNTKPSTPFNLSNGIFLSPLVRSIADKEKISLPELESIKGTGVDGRITKEDILHYIGTKQSTHTSNNISSGTDNVEIIEMSRMRKLIADHMVKSVQTSPHVTSFHEVDVTNMVKWRNQFKDEFLKQHGQKLTFTPLFIEAVINAIIAFPMINISLEGNQIIKKNNINIGMATALPDGNLIVPVIHKANKLNNNALVEKVNDLANRARNNKLQPTEIKGGTFTITNVGSFGNLSGTPIINQPEVAILAIGTIKKRPAVIETPDGDLIGIRHQMILSLSYDHRVVDGSLGGMFLKQIADNMEAFDGKKWL